MDLTWLITLITLSLKDNDNNKNILQKQEHKKRWKPQIKLHPRTKMIIVLFFIILALILFVAICIAIVPGTESGLVYNKNNLTNI